MQRVFATAIGALAAFPLIAGVSAEQPGRSGPERGDRELALSGAGTNDTDFKNGHFGFIGDLGWYWRTSLIVGLRQSVNYASVEGDGVSNDFLKGASRVYVDYQLPSGRTRPFGGASLGLVYGDGVKNSAVAGLEAGARYYVLPRTYVLWRAEYQWFFNNGAGNASDAFQDNALAYTLGLGYNF